MTTATMRLLDALRAAQGNCTDYRAGKLLGMTTATVSRWRTGKSHMSMANVSRACELAGVPGDTWEWQIRIGAEREKGPDGDIYREALKDLDSYRATGKPSPNGLFAMLRHYGGHAAIILIACLGAAVGVFLPGKDAVAATRAAVNEVAPVYIMRTIASAPGARCGRWLKHIDVPRRLLNPYRSRRTARLSCRDASQLAHAMTELSRTRTRQPDHLAGNGETLRNAGQLRKLMLRYWP